MRLEGMGILINHVSTLTVVETVGGGGVEVPGTPEDGPDVGTDGTGGVPVVGVSDIGVDFGGG